MSTPLPNLSRPLYKKLGFSVTLPESRPIIIPPIENVVSDKIEIESVVDQYTEKRVIAYIKVALGRTVLIILWEGAAYDAIGQWTDADVIARIQEIYA